MTVSAPPRAAICSATPLQRPGNVPPDLDSHWRLSDGRPVCMRPVAPGDRAGLARFVAELSRESRLARFPGLVKALTSAQLAELTEPDFDHHVGYVITVPDPAGERLIGEARFMVDGNSGSAGIALVVADAWHRQGIGAHALLMMAGAASRRRLRWLRADVPHGNGPMLALLQHCGFRSAPHPEDADLIQLHLTLPTLPA